MISKHILVPLAVLFVIGFFSSIITGIEFTAADPSKNKEKIMTDAQYE